jgi:hypothetical protein
MIRVIQHNYARSYDWRIAALQMGVERRADVMRFQQPTSEGGGIGISHSAYERRQRKTLWTAIRRGSGLVVVEWTDFSRGAKKDLIATDVRRKGEKFTWIANVEDQKMTHFGETGAQVALAGSNSATRLCPCRRLQCSQQTMGTKIPSPAGCCFLG